MVEAHNIRLYKRTKMKNTLIIASGNNGKIKEIKEICKSLNVEILSLEDAFGEKVDIPETGKTFLDNAQLKANWVRDKKECWVLADDSGLQVDYLDGAPGVYSARYAGENCNDSLNIKKLLSELKDVSEDKRGAGFTSTMVLSGPNGESVDVTGECRGSIIHESKGTEGFGYDPVFVPEGYDKSFAELDSKIKNDISHRSRALKQLRGKLEQLFQ